MAAPACRPDHRDPFGKKVQHPDPMHNEPLQLTGAMFEEAIAVRLLQE